MKHSASPAMQNAGLTALNLNWKYLAFHVKPDGLASAIAGARAMKFLGLNLTVPHKVAALSLVDELDDSGRKWGAINTIRFEGCDTDGCWKPLGALEIDFAGKIRSVGFNTDTDALVRALREDLGMELRGATVVVLGAGGAGVAAALRLAEEGVKQLYLVNRTATKAAEAMRQIKDRFPATEIALGYPGSKADLLLNATSLGLKATDSLPCDIEQFKLSQAGAVYDMVYRPAETSLLRTAKAAGCRCANGLGMLLYQGAKALEIWTGRPAPTTVMRQALEKNVYGK